MGVEKAGPKAKLENDDQRVQRWLEWYERNQARSEYRRKRYEMLTEEQRQSIRDARRAKYAERVKEGWAEPNRRRPRSQVIEYRDLLIALLVQRDNGICGICGSRVEPGDESPDHIIPKSLGGQNTAENIRLSHRRCNNRRPRKPADIRQKLEAQASSKEALS